MWCLQYTASTVAKVWSRNLGDIDGSPILRNGRLYLGTNAGTVHALNPADGTDLWAVPYSSGDGAIKAFPWVDTTTSVPSIFFATDGKVHAVRDDGSSASQLWAPVSVGNPSSVLVYGDAVYLGSTDGNGSLVQIPRAIGTPATLMGLGDPLVAKSVGTPAYDPNINHVVAGTDEGMVYTVLVLWVLAGAVVMFILAHRAEGGRLSPARVLLWTATIWLWPLFALLAWQRRK